MNTRLRLALLIIIATLVGTSWLSADEPLKNQDVITLLHAGVAPHVVVDKIKASACNFDVSANVLAALAKAKVPSDVLSSMIAKTASPTTDSGKPSAEQQSATGIGDLVLTMNKIGLHNWGLWEPCQGECGIEDIGVLLAIDDRPEETPSEPAIMGRRVIEAQRPNDKPMRFVGGSTRDTMALHTLDAWAAHGIEWLPPEHDVTFHLPAGPHHIYAEACIRNENKNLYIYDLWHTGILTTICTSTPYADIEVTIPAGGTVRHTLTAQTKITKKVGILGGLLGLAACPQLELH
jgi:hypothetical protein